VRTGPNKVTPFITEHTFPLSSQQDDMTFRLAFTVTAMPLPIASTRKKNKNFFIDESFNDDKM
jgi:hypothetical protein